LCSTAFDAEISFSCAECVKIQETVDASQGFFVLPFTYVYVSFTYLYSCFSWLLISFSFVIVTLAMAHARISTLEAELKASAEAMENANAAKVSAERADAN
jgi:hypothetical protein